MSEHGFYFKEEVTAAYNSGWWIGMSFGIAIGSFVTFSLGLLWLFSD